MDMIFKRAEIYDASSWLLAKAAQGNPDAILTGLLTSATTIPLGAPFTLSLSFKQFIQYRLVVVEWKETQARHYVLTKDR